MPPAYPGPVTIPAADEVKESKPAEPLKTDSVQTDKQKPKLKAEKPAAAATTKETPTYQQGFDPDPTSDPYQREPGQDG
jgi:hypothetical protein